MNRKGRIQLVNLIGTLAFLAIIAGSCYCRADARSDADVQTAIAIALALRDRPAKTPETPAKHCPTFAEARAVAIAAHKPLVVFVNQPWYDVRDCVACPHTDATLPTQVWVGVVGPDGVMYRKTVDGMPLESDILAAAHKIDKDLHAPPQTQAGWSNVGSCPCQSITGRCQCVPASKCGRGGCPSVEQLQQQAKPMKFTLPTTQASYSVPCLT